MTQYDHEYPPGEWSVAEIERALTDSPATYPIPTVDERDRWRAIRDGPVTGTLAERIIEDADDLRGESVPALPATAILAWVRDGERGYQRPSKARLNRLSTFALAECLEGDGRFLDDVLDYAWALCEQAGWSYPTNYAESELLDGLPVEAPAAARSVEIRKCEIALLLAEVDHLLGDQVHAALRRRIRTETDRRLFEPYEASEDFHWFDPPAFNKNAVCNGRTLLAAMYLIDDTSRLARLIEKGIQSLGHYLAGFDHDGCTAEGMGYWNFGFKFYVWLSAHLETRTDGRLSLMSPRIVSEIARFPMRVELSPGRYAPFSDVPKDVRVRSNVACWLGERLDIPWLVTRGIETLDDRPIYNGLPSEVRDLLWCPQERPAVEWMPSHRRFFAGHQWWIARAEPADPDGMVVAAKGGHNGEPHNHNDCGSFVVHVGGETLLTDLGAPGYEQYHGGRYEALPARSLGHSVPYVNGCEQATGSAAATSVVDRVEMPDRDAIRYELARCYPDEAGLASLERSIALARADHRVVVEDRAQFTSGAHGHVLQSVLIAYHPIEVSDGVLSVRGDSGSITVRPEGDVERTDIEAERLVDAFRERTWGAPAAYTDVWRATIPATEDADPIVSLHIEPAMA